MVEALSGGRWQGSSTALATPTYSDSNFGSWTTTGSEVTESSDVISFSITTRTANNGVSVDLGSTLSSTQWVMRFKLNFSTLTYSGSSSMLYFMAGLSSASSATGLSNSGIGQDFIGLQKRLETGGGDAEGWGVVAYYNSGGFDNPEDSQFTNPASTTGGDGSGNYWVEIVRYMDGSTNKMSIELFSDSSYSTSIQKISKTINVASTDALQYVLITNGHGVSTTSGTTIAGSVRDIQVWNNTTVATEDEKTTLTNVPANSRYEETDTRKIYRKVTPSTANADFGNITAQGNWEKTGSGGALTFTNGINQESGGSGNTQMPYLDLQNSSYLGSGNYASETKWVLRWKQTWASSPDNYGTPFMVLSSTTGYQSASQNYIGIRFDSGQIGAGGETSSQVDGATSNTGVSTSYTSTTYYMEMVRDGSDMYVRNYTSSAYDTIAQESSAISIGSGTYDLRYIKMIPRWDTGSGDYDTTWDYIKFYNGVSSVETRNWIERNTAA